MLRGLGSWLGLERAGEEKLLSAEERSSSAEEEEAAAAAGAEPAVQSSEQVELQADSEALLSQAKGLGSECPALLSRRSWRGESGAEAARHRQPRGTPAPGRKAALPLPLGLPRHPGPQRRGVGLFPSYRHRRCGRGRGGIFVRGEGLS